MKSRTIQYLALELWTKKNVFLYVGSDLFLTRRDFMGLSPETTHMFTWLFGDRGTPDGFRHMNGYSSKYGHTCWKLKLTELLEMDYYDF